MKYIFIMMISMFPCDKEYVLFKKLADFSSDEQISKRKPYFKELLQVFEINLK